jgi:hypothetical protein
MAADWIGIGGDCADSRCAASDPTLIQAGAASQVGRSGQPSFYTWFETLPSAPVTTPLAARSGDRLSVAIGRASSSRWRIQLSNATTGKSWSTTVRYRSSQRSADFVTERPTLANPSGVGMPNRGATSFRNVRVNGSAARFHANQGITMDQNGHRYATPSGPEGKKADGFSVCGYASSCGSGS